MRKLLVWALLAAFWIGRGAAAPAKDPVCGEVGPIVAEMAEISGLTERSKVKCEAITRDRVKEFLEERVRDSVKPADIQAEEAALKKLGFAPPDFDLKKTTIDLLTEQAAAFYDFHKKKLFIIETASDFDERFTLAHELSHALADQHFNLDKFIGHGNQDDDSALARLAVMEGQATWLMSEYVARQTGRSLKNSPALAKSMAEASSASSGEFPVFDRAPLYLRETLLFPYTQGMMFQQALVEKMGQAAFTEVFRRPPESTQQILHPEKYLAHLKPVRPPLPPLPSPRNYRGFTDGEMGELDNAILLRQYVGEKESAAVAPEWRGGYFVLFERKHSAPDWRRMVLAYASEWSGPAAAREYFEMYQKVLKGKWRSVEVTSRSANAVAGRGDDGYFLLRLDGTRVTSLEGLPDAAAAGSTDAKSGLN